MKDKPKSNNDELTNIAMVLIGGVLFLLLSPLLMLTFVFSYLTWASFNYSEERKWVRSGMIAIVGFLITLGFWDSLKLLAPNLFEGIVSAAKLTKILAIPAVKNAAYSYPALLAAEIYLLENRIKPSLMGYEYLRRSLGFLFFPFTIFQIMAAGLINFFFISVFHNQEVKRGSLAYFFIIITAASISTVVVSSLFAAMGDASGFGHFFGATAVGYLAAYWYMVIVHGREAEPQAENHILGMKKNSGIHIGRIVHPKRMNLNLSWRDINHHIHILGQPGVGKSVLLKNIYAYQIMQGEGLLMVDLKADYKIREDFKALCCESGRDDDFILIDLSHPESSYGYNPLLFGNATELKDKIIGAIEWSEPYYKKVAERTLLTVLKGFVWIRENKNLAPSLEDLLVSISSVQGLTVLAEQVESESIKADIYEMAAGFSKDFIKDLESLRTELALLTKAEFGSIFKSPRTLNVFSAIMNRKVILVNLDGQTYNESAKKFGRLLLADLRSASGAIVTNVPEHERPRFTVLVDEFSDIVATEDMAKTFVGFLNRCRGSGIGVVIAHQSLGDFKDPMVRSQIMDSTETMFSFVQKDPETCEILASVVGTKEAYEKTKQTREWMFGDDNTGMGSKKLVHEYIYHPNVFKNLDTGVAIYAAKKPSRFGTVHVKMLEIAHLSKDTDYKEVKIEKGKGTFDLNGQINNRRTEYVSAVKGRTTSSEDLEI
jgi:hypothetical protein